MLTIILLLILYVVVVIACIVFVRICYKQDKKWADEQAEKNKTVFFNAPNNL